MVSINGGKFRKSQISLIKGIIGHFDKAGNLLNTFSEDDFTDSFALNLFKGLKQIKNDSLDLTPDVLCSVSGEGIKDIEGLFKGSQEHSLNTSVFVFKHQSARRVLRGRFLNMSEEIIDRTDAEIEKEISDALALFRERSAKKIKTLNDTIDDTVKYIDNMNSRGGSTVDYCIPEVDSHISHMRAQTHVLAGDSGTGKTAFCLSAMLNQVINGLSVAIFCGESVKEELILRIVSIILKKPFLEVINPENADEVAQCLKDLSKYKDSLHIFGKRCYEHSVSGINMEVHRLNERFGLDMIYVDYLQNMKRNRGKNKLFEDVGANIYGLDSIFAEHNVAGTVLSQLNRDKTTERPTMRSLKYSSDIENVAHIITFLFNPQREPSRWHRIEWYTDKTRLINPFFASLGFIAQWGEYTGLYNAQKTMGEI